MILVSENDTNTKMEHLKCSQKKKRFLSHCLPSSYKTLEKKRKKRRKFFSLPKIPEVISEASTRRRPSAPPPPSWSAWTQHPHCGLIGSVMHEMVMKSLLTPGSLGHALPPEPAREVAWADFLPLFFLFFFFCHALPSAIGSLRRALPPSPDSPSHALPPTPDSSHALPPAFGSLSHALPPTGSLSHALPPTGSLSHALPPTPGSLGHALPQPASVDCLTPTSWLAA